MIPQNLHDMYKQIVFIYCRLFTPFGVNWCKIYWTGVSQRAMFLHQCLEKFPYGKMHKKVRYLIRGMRWIGRKLENAEQRGQTLLQTGGWTQIAGSIFGGIGVGKFLPIERIITPYFGGKLSGYT